MSESFLSYDQFRKECKALGESVEKKQDALAVDLHKLGIALNYKDHPRLCDTHVLKPQWVTGGIYCILNAPVLAERKGVLFEDDLRKILPEGKYPGTMPLFVLDLMRKFELCFSFSDDATGRHPRPRTPSTRSRSRRPRRSRPAHASILNTTTTQSCPRDCCRASSCGRIR